MKEFLHKTHTTDQTSSLKGRSTLRHTPERKIVAQSPTTPPVLQRKPQCSCDGGCPTCTGNIRVKPIQAKLTVGQPNDRYEQEADRVADQVMRMPEPTIQRAPACSSCPDNEEEDLVQTKPIGDQITPLVQRQEDSGTTEEPEEEEPIQKKLHANKSPPVTPGIQNQIQALKGNGQPLPAATRSYFEPRFGRSLGDVRVHTDAKAAETAGAIRASAFTIGTDIVFDSRRYKPSTSEGYHLLAHELTHVIQQKPNREIIQRNPGPPIPSKRARDLFDYVAIEANKKVVEQPPCHNRGPQVDKYIKECGLPLKGKCGHPWCACFIKYCLNRAGIPNTVTAASGSVRVWANNGGKRWYHQITPSFKPIFGDIFFMLSRSTGSHPCNNHECSKGRGTGGHVGVIFMVEGSDVLTVEGNSHLELDEFDPRKDNDGVVLARRPINSLHGVVRIPDP